MTRGKTVATALVLTASFSAGGEMTSSIQHNPDTGQVVVRSGRLELVVETKGGLNPRSLRDLKSGRIHADRDYLWSWPGAEFPQLEGPPAIDERPDGSRSVVLKGRLGSILVQQSFSVSRQDPDAIVESIAISNPSDKTIATAGFKCGFAKGLRDGENGLPDVTNIVTCPVPYRRETDGKIQEKPLQALTGAVGAEGWVLSDGKGSFLISKFNDDGFEWSLMEPVKRGNLTVLRFGGAGQWKSAHPEGAGSLEPGKTFRFGETRLQALDGDWKQAYYAYRRYTENKGCRTPKGYNPPVHWNELYDNGYYRKVAAALDPHKKDTPELREFLTKGNVKLMSDLYSLEAMKQEAAKAKELGCEALYLDPGWDTGPSHHVWDSERLGSQESFVELMRSQYGLKTSIWIGLGNGGGPFADPFVLPIEARLRNQDGSHPLTLCVASPAFREAKKRLLIELGKKGVAFMMFDSTGWTGSCYDPHHGHSNPSTIEDHVNGVFDILTAVKKECPDVLIELHDPVSGPSNKHYSPTYYRFAKPNSFDCLWGHELMWSSMDDLLSGRAISLYYCNLAFNIPIYLHVNLKQDNANAMMFWWYASTCRHLGVGGKSSQPVWEAQKKAMEIYMANKRFFTQGEFHGLDETIHAHTLPDIHESVVNVFNLDEKPVEKTIRFRLGEIGLGSAAAGQSMDVELAADVNIPARGHQLLHVSAKPGEAPRITKVVESRRPKREHIQVQ